MAHSQSISLSRPATPRAPIVWSVPVLAVCALVAIGVRLGVYGWLAQPFGGLAEASCRFDCGWYERIALQGYGAHADWGDNRSYPHWAFFPLFPMLLSGLHAIFGGSARVLGMLLSSLAFFGFLVVGARYLADTRRRARIGLWLLVALLFPYGFFFTAVYTEALFALLSASALLALHRRRALAAAALAALASATRPTGVLLTPILVADRLAALWRGRHRTDRAALLGETLLPIAVAPLGLFVYMLVQYRSVGDALAFSHVQVLWHRAWGNPFARLWDGLAGWDFSRLPMAPSHSHEAGFAVLGLAGAIWLGLRRRGAEAFFLASCILLPAASGLDSLPRFVGCNPVFLFAVYDLAARLEPSRAALGALLLVLGGAQFILLSGWYAGAGGVF